MDKLHLHDNKNFDSKRIGLAAMSAFFNIALQWQLKPDQQMKLLGMVPRSTFYLWRDKVEKKISFDIPKDTLERISYLLGIYKNLHILLPDAQSANEWIHRPNQAAMFNQKSALEKMLAGNVVDLADVRRFLDFERGR